MAAGPKSSRTWGYWLTTRFLWAVVLGAAALTCYWIFWEGVDEWRDSRRWRNFPFHLRDGCDPHTTLDACQLKQVIYLWLPTAAAALAAIPLIAMGAHLRISRHSILSRQLPPRCFWASWCGGVSVADALVVLFWAGVNATWMGWIMYRYELMAPFFEKGMSHFQVQWVLVSVALGQLLTPNLVLLFYPVTRGSVLLQLTGISYPNAIRYHRWLGHATLFFATAHSLGFWSVWLWQERFLKEAFEQGARINNLMGGLSFVSALALWLTSLEAARRWSYDLFYKMHHAGFWGFMLLGCMHYSPLFWAFLPGMMLYAVDAIYRLSQVSGRTAEVLDAHASQDARVACLTIASPTWGVAPTGYVWINAPAISRSEWHPFEYISVEDSSPDLPTGLAIHTKAYSRWTKKFATLMQQQGRAIHLRVEGPYPELPPQDLVGNKKGIAMVAGGIGITAALSVFKELGHHHAEEGKESAGKPAAVTPPVLLIWAARNLSELTLLAPKVVQIAEEAGINMQERATLNSQSCGSVKQPTGITYRRGRPVGSKFVERSPQNPVKVHVYFTGDVQELSQHIDVRGSEQASNVAPPQYVLEWTLNNPTPSVPRILDVNATTTPYTYGTVGNGAVHAGFGANGVSTSGFGASGVSTNEAGANGVTANVIDGAIRTGFGANGLSANGVVANGAIHVNGVVNGAIHINGVENGAHSNGYVSNHATAPGMSSTKPTPLCPVLPFHSLAQQAAHKIQLHAVVLAGSLIALLMVRALGSVRAAKEWPTAWLGSAYVLSITFCTLVPGLVALGMWRLVYARWSIASQALYSPRKKEVRADGARDPLAAEQEPLLCDDESGANESEQDAARRWGGTTARVVCEHGVQAGVVRENVREGDTERCHYRWLINLGRPPLEQILKGWVNNLEQLPSRVEAEAEVVQVYGMGPEPLVLASQLLCDDMNRGVGSGGSSHRHLKLRFERKTFDL